MQIDRPAVAAMLALALGAGVVLAAGPAQPNAALVARARAIHKRVLTIDSHVDIAGDTYATPALDPGGPTPLKCDLVKMKAGGLDGVFLAVFVGQRPELDAAGYKAALQEATAKFDAIDRLTKMHPELCALARTPDDVEKIHRTGRRVILIGVENGYPIGEDLGIIRKFQAQGARYITLVHTSHNQLADSANVKEPMHGGLSPLGRRAVAEMNRLGVMVDVSHASARTFWDVVRMSKAPIIASHSGCSAVNDNPRNLDDRQLRALARNGGVIQIVAVGEYLKAPSPERARAIQALRDELGRGRGARQAQPATPEQQAEMQKRRAIYEERMKAIDAKYPGATLDDLVDHIDHAVRIAGIDHVGIGTDFDGGGGVPGFNDHSEAGNVTLKLVERGYTEEQIARIWGGNLLRVWRQVEKAAGR